MATLQKTNHRGLGLVDLGLIDSNFAAVNVVSMTTAQRTAALATTPEGTLVYDTTLHKMHVRVAAGWEEITSA